MPVAHESGKAQHQPAVESQRALGRKRVRRMTETRTIDAIRDHHDLARIDAIRRNGIGQYPCHGQGAIGVPPRIPLRPARQRLQCQAIVVGSLLEQRRIDLEQHRQTKAPADPDTSRQQQIEALVQDIGPVRAYGNGKRAVRDHAIGQFRQFINEPGQMALKPGNTAGIGAERLVFSAGRRDDDDFMTEFAQGADHFFDMDVLAVFGSGAMVVKDFHEFDSRELCRQPFCGATIVFVFGKLAAKSRHTAASFRPTSANNRLRFPILGIQYRTKAVH